ncbi:YdeI/OmpD-associated family protein, partial [Streptomyces scabiei]|uniref:YdeI/OmpD-associated family protein n=1 Tax=Streptomyces scabiei TaxID=1930 RepID=UPI0038F7519C
AFKSVYYDEAVEEAICFGWIDSIANKRDAESKYQFFAKRKPKSNWSKLNRERAEKMISQGLMTPSGAAMIELAKQTGT